MRPSFYPNGRNGHKQRSSLWGTGPVDPGGRSQVHGWAEPQRLPGGCDGNATSGRTGPGRCWSVQTGPGPRGHPILEDRVLGPCWVWRGPRAWGMGSLPPWRRGPRARAPLGWAPCCPGAVAPCHRWLQSHLVCRRNVPVLDHTLPLLLLAPPARKEGVRELAVFAQAPEWQSETPGPAASDACLLSCRR